MLYLRKIPSGKIEKIRCLSWIKALTRCSLSLSTQLGSRASPTTWMISYGKSKLIRTLKRERPISNTRELYLYQEDASDCRDTLVNFSFQLGRIAVRYLFVHLFLTSPIYYLKVLIASFRSDHNCPTIANMPTSYIKRALIYTSHSKRGHKRLQHNYTTI